LADSDNLIRRGENKTMIEKQNRLWLALKDLLPTVHLIQSKRKEKVMFPLFWPKRDNYKGWECLWMRSRKKNSSVTSQTERVKRMRRLWRYHCSRKVTFNTATSNSFGNNIESIERWLWRTVTPRKALHCWKTQLAVTEKNGTEAAREVTDNHKRRSDASLWYAGSGRREKRRPDHQRLKAYYMMQTWWLLYSLTVLSISELLHYLTLEN